MRFPDLLVHVKKIEERQRMLAFDLEQLRADLIKALPEAKQWLGEPPRKEEDSSAPTLF